MKAHKEAWRLGLPVPERDRGHVVVLAWNEVALTTALRVLQEHYPPGAQAMADAVRDNLRRSKPANKAIRTLSGDGE